ncbi:MAG: DUF4326 domain-containing protein [Pseudonocardiales bacterium]|nr:DUF4326 domain-containing protein [Pseudonocardiales bacterium]
MSAPRRVQRQRTKGWRMPEGAVYVGRPTAYGNPWTDADFRYLIPDALGRRLAMVDKYETELCLRGGTGEYDWVTLDEIRERLTGRDLACWCALDLPCHADVLLRVANP